MENANWVKHEGSEHKKCQKATHKGCRESDEDTLGKKAYIHMRREDNKALVKTMDNHKQGVKTPKTKHKTEREENTNTTTK